MTKLRTFISIVILALTLNVGTSVSFANLGAPCWPPCENDDDDHDPSDPPDCSNGNPC